MLKHERYKPKSGALSCMNKWDKCRSVCGKCGNCTKHIPEMKFNLDLIYCSFNQSRDYLISGYA